MNIRQAKDYISHSVKIYLKKDEFGDYKIPVVRQRPIFLVGAPGIGKTAIMEQIAEELGIALVSYSMTHHTRQSALGLPFITKKEYDGKAYDVSEYTMSEIIASVYETMEASGSKEGILFLDEINCVSETLAPSMLQFLQYKVFGKHQVPEGWVVVTAGNPPEYNKSVREFDVVTLDRLKVLSVEADYQTWKEYAVERKIHNAILNFLELKKEYFYHIETTAEGRKYVTARGWEDLSQIITMYEEDELKVDENLVGQYLRSEKIVKEFCAYYDLYNKYKNDYKINEILAGRYEDTVITKAGNAEFDERLSLLGMLLDKVQNDIQDAIVTSDYLSELMAPLKAVKTADSVLEALYKQAELRDVIIEKQQKANALSKTEKYKHKKIKQFLENASRQIAAENADGNEAAFECARNMFNEEVAAMKNNVSVVSEEIKNLFGFVSKAFEQGNEMLILVTELTVNKYSSRFISMFGSDEYHKYNELLMISERQNDMKEQIKNLEIPTYSNGITELTK